MEICELGQKKYRPQNKYYFDKIMFICQDVGITRKKFMPLCETTSQNTIYAGMYLNRIFFLITF